MIRNPLYVYGLIAVFGIVCLAYGLWLGGREVLFATSGARTTAVVVSKSVDGSADHVRYRFRAQDGTTVDGDDIVNSDTWAALAIGGPITVEYAGVAPATLNRVADNAPLLVLSIVLLTGIVFTFLAGPRFRARFRYVRLERRLLREGIETEATVDDVVRLNLRLHYRIQRQIRYRYADRDGGRHTGQSEPLMPRDADSWRKGAEALIRYDPARPDVSIWTGRRPTGAEQAPGAAPA